MSWSLLVFCAAAFGLMAAMTSAVSGLCLKLLDRAAASIVPRQRVHLWVAVSAAPAIVGGVALLAALCQGAGFGVDHCAAHGPHHPHICPHHVAATPSLLVTALACLVGLRIVGALVALVLSSRRASATCETLLEGSTSVQGVNVFPSKEPRAFVLGLRRPRVFVSQALLALSPNVVKAVIAHEQAHASHRDVLQRVVARAMSAAHFPLVEFAIQRRLATSQELAADAAAASITGDPVGVAAALLELARSAEAVQRRSLLAFTDGDIALRVRALVSPPSTSLVPRHALLTIGVVLTLAALSAHDAVHHGLETLLGALN